MGIEFVGEIVTDFPDKKVTLVHSGERVLEFLGNKASEKTHKWLKSEKVELILNDRIEVENLTGPDYVTKNGDAYQGRCTLRVHWKARRIVVVEGNGSCPPARRK